MNAPGMSGMHRLRAEFSMLPLALTALVLIAALMTVAVLPAGASTSKANAKTRAASGPSGNAATLAFYRQVVAATRRMGTEVLTIGGSYTIVEYQGSLKHWYTGGTSSRAGYQPAADLVTIAASGGRVKFVVDAIVHTRPPGFSPFGLLLTASGEYLLAGGAPVTFTPPTTHAYQPCMGRSTGAPYVGGYTKVGVASGYGFYGHFGPMRRVGANEIVTSTYPWGSKQVETEVDTIAASTHLPSAGVVRVSSGGGLSGFSYHWTVRWYGATAYPPNSNGVCQQPGTPGP